MGFNHVLQMIQFIFLTVASTSNFAVAKPRCDDHCGNVSIPFPFGTKQGCYGHESFLITCNQNFTPPRPFLQYSNREIKNISLDGQLTLMHYVAYNCPDGKRIPLELHELKLPKFLTVNDTGNKFTGIGCGTFGTFIGWRRHSYVTQTGCMDTCRKVDGLVERNCNGTGCCHIPVPDDVWSMRLGFSGIKRGNVSGLGNCSYGFVVKEGAYTFSPHNLTNMIGVGKRMPMLIDWVIGTETCEEAKLNALSYACKGVNATCLDHAYGYRCSCKEGYQGNPYLQNGCQDVNECEDENLNDCIHKYCVNTPGSFNCSCPKGYHGDGKKDGKGCVAPESLVYKLSSGISLVVICLLLAALWIHVELKRRRLIKKRRNFFNQNGGKLLQGSIKIYSESELQKATNNFSKTQFLGKGSYGSVYKGSLNNITVAIKKPIAVDSKRNEQFTNEVMVLCKINHKNVVKLLGCCLETEVPLLVYEFISNGTLYDQLHDKAKARSLSWETRLKIAAETAGGLLHLHSASTQIIHRDVKSANILLDDTYTAKVSDFGSSKLVPLDQTQRATFVQGTYGYLDPQFMKTGQLTEKSDVYSFGVVLMELLTGKMVLSPGRQGEEIVLTNFFDSEMKQNRLFQVLAFSVESEENKEQVMKVAELARRCVNDKGDDRPSMKEVAKELEGLRVGVKDSCVQSEYNAKDADESSSIANSDGLSIGFDSLNDATTLPVDGGR